MQNGNDSLIRDWCNHLILEDRSPSTIKVYRSALNRFGSYVNKPFKDVNRLNIESFLATGDYAASTKKRLNIIIIQFYNWMLDHDLLKKHPMPEPLKIRLPVRKRSYLTPEEIQHLTEYFYNRCERDGLMFEILICAGLRAEELLNLTLTEIRFDVPAIQLIGKGNKERIIPLKQNIANKLREYCFNNHIKSGYIFRNQKEGRLSKSYLTLMFSNARKELGIKKLKPHITRHTYAMVCLNNGMPISSLQKVLGHTNITTTMIYAEAENKTIVKDVNMYAPDVERMVC